MVKKLAIISILLWVIGCSTIPSTPKIVYKVKEIPIYVVPKVANMPNRPDLIINHLTDAQKQDIGFWVQYLTISFAQLKTYTCQLQTIIDQYQLLADKSPLPVQPIKSQQISNESSNNSLIINFNKSCGIK